MSRLKLKYVQAFVDRATGRPFYYFRRLGFPRVRLPGLAGSTEFMDAYRAALDSRPEPIGMSRSKPGSISAAIAGYYASSAFRDGLSPSSKIVRRAVLEAFRRAHGDKPIATLPKKFLVALFDTMTPAGGRNWLKAIRALMQHCVRHELIGQDPTLGIKLRPVKGDGFHTWSEEQIALYEANHPVGTKPRLALGLHTAQRRGDVIRMGRQHIRDGLLHVRQQKTGTELLIPIHPDLQATLDAGPCGDLTFLLNANGRPFDGKVFTQWFAQQCAAAGLASQCTFHGLRKAACVRLAEAGCTASEIASISGHKTLREIERYTKGADQARLARNAMARTQERKQEHRVSK